MIISIKAEKAFDKFLHLVIIKTLSKLEIEGKLLQLIKCIYTTPIANIYLNSERLKTKVSTLTIFIQHSTESSSRCNEKKRKGWRKGQRKEDGSKKNCARK